MKKLLNTLYITSEKTYLSKEGETVQIEIDQEVKHRFPIHLLEGIVCFGHVMCSPALMHMCACHKVSLSFLSARGKFLAKVQGPVSGNVLLRREQYRRADDESKSHAIARSTIFGKLANSKTVLMRGARDSQNETISHLLSKSAGHITYLVKNLENTNNLDQLRGLEGEAAKAYFSVFDHLILSQKEDFFFHERSRRPPLDNMNALLSFLYTLLAHDVISAIEAIGLDPAVGFLHRDRPGRPSLALDLMEEFRSFIADRLALTLVNRNQIKGKGFIKSESGDIRMNDDTRKEVLLGYQKRKQEEITHPFLCEKIPIGLIPHVQASLLARHLRGDLDAYPPFIWKS
ncbi:MAG: type I-C CRISPR-associated endonuclease Cas1c [Parachlamydiaceae bacterium]